MPEHAGVVNNTIHIVSFVTFHKHSICYGLTLNLLFVGDKSVRFKFESLLSAML